MTLAELLSKLNQLDIKLWVEDGRLRYNAPEGVLSDELKAEIIKYKPEIIEFLQQTEADQNTAFQIQKAPRNGKLPVSYAQKWLWVYEKLQDSLDIFKGPLLKFAYFNLGKARPGRFFATIHHLVGDNTSLMILLNDFQTAYQQLVQTGTITLHPEFTSLTEYVTELNRYSRSEQLDRRANIG